MSFSSPVFLFPSLAESPQHIMGTHASVSLKILPVTDIVGGNIPDCNSRQKGLTNNRAPSAIQAVLFSGTAVIS